MILQALYEYYRRKANDPNSGIAPEGFQWQEIKFIVVVDEDGRFVDLKDERGEDRKGRRFLLPKAKPRSGKDAWKTTFLLWDHYGYVLGHPKQADKKSRAMAENQHSLFVDELKNLPLDLREDKGVNAIINFYESGQVAAAKAHRNWAECARISGCNLTFKLDGDPQLVPERDAVVQYQRSLVSSPETSREATGGRIVGRCLITGDRGPIARIHTATPILGSKSNARLVAFQKNSGYDSYKKEQAINAPISLRAESAYTTALKHLLTSKTNKQMISDATIVFWAEQTEESDQSFDLEMHFAWYIADRRDDPDRGVQAVKSLYDAIHTGRLSHSSERFHVLGIAPNAARLSVRLYREGTVREFGENIKRHFDDFEIARSPGDPEYLSLYRILDATALEYKMENVQPNLAAAVIESILDGTPYPATLLQQCIRRIRAEVARKDQNGKLMQNVTRTRAAILKASLNRLYRSQPNNTNKEILMALDPQNTDVAYLLGRLFALLERIQEESAKPSKLNSTIRERFYASFSSSPSVVMPLLMRLKNHHLAKLGSERDYLKRWFEEQIGEVIDLLKSASIPAHLALEQQAQFAVGYYHQRMHRKEKQS
jgi:CRISPR-associated protein Csd1